MSMSTPGRLGIGIIGMGHVGPVIGSALRAVGHQIVAVSASSDASRERADAMLPGVPLASPEEVVRRSEVVILAVPDDQIGPLVSGLADLGVWQAGTSSSTYPAPRASACWPRLRPPERSPWPSTRR